MESGERGLTHVDGSGEARMVDVTGKEVTIREARAEAWVHMRRETLDLIRDNTSAKGDVLGVARIAGVLGAKKTSDLIPLCHGLSLNRADVHFRLDDEANRVWVEATTVTEGKTGVEMEALAAVAIAALTIYDMCKAVDRAMEIGGIRVTYKSGGRSGTHHFP